jgi:hypothetical protein
MRMEAGSVLSLRFALDSNQPSHGSFFLSFALRDTLVYTPYRCRPSEILGDRATKKKLSPWPAVYRPVGPLLCCQDDNTGACRQIRSDV